MVTATAMTGTMTGDGGHQALATAAGQEASRQRQDTGINNKHVILTNTFFRDIRREYRYLISRLAREFTYLEVCWKSGEGGGLIYFLFYFMQCCGSGQFRIIRKKIILFLKIQTWIRIRFPPIRIRKIIRIYNTDFMCGSSSFRRFQP